MGAPRQSLLLPRDDRLAVTREFVHEGSRAPASTVACKAGIRKVLAPTAAAPGNTWRTPSSAMSTSIMPTFRSGHPAMSVPWKRSA